MPNKQPINKRVGDLIKQAKSFTKTSGSVDKASRRAQTSAAREASKAAKDQQRAATRYTAELKKQNKLLKENARLAGGGRKPGGGGGAGSQSLAAKMGVRVPGLGALAGAAVGSIIGAVTSNLSASISKYSGTIKTQRDVAGMVNTAESGAMMRRAVGMGFGPEEVLGGIKGVGRAVGSRGAGQFQKGALNALLDAQVEYGIDPGEGVGLFGALRKGGTQGFEDQAGKGGAGLRMWKRMFIDAHASGLEKTRVPEHLANVVKGTNMVGQNIAGVVDSASISQMMASFGQLGAGFQGERAAGVMNAFQQAMTQASTLKGDPAAQALMLQDIGNFGGPGSTGNIFEARKQLEKGIGDPANVQNMIQGMLKRSGGDQKRAAWMLNAATGISLTKAEALTGFGAGGFEDKKGFEDAAKEAANEALSVDDKMLTLASEQASVDLQQFENGKELTRVSIQIQQLITDLVTMLVPIAKSTLEVIRELLINVKVGWDMIKDWISGDDRTKNTQGRLDEARQIAIGGGTTAEKTQKLGAILREQEKEVQWFDTKLAKRQAVQDSGGLGRHHLPEAKSELHTGAEDAATQMQNMVSTLRSEMVRDSERKKQAAERVTELQNRDNKSKKDLEDEKLTALKQIAKSTKKSEKTGSPLAGYLKPDVDTEAQADD